MSFVKLNQNRETAFSTFPLFVTGFGKITSNAEILSVVTITSLSSEISYTSLTFPLISFFMFSPTPLTDSQLQKKRRRPHVLWTEAYSAFAVYTMTLLFYGAFVNGEGLVIVSAVLDAV
jgi:hypothetical protein